MPTITYTVDETAAVAHFAAQTAYGTPPSGAPTSSLLRAVEEIRPLAGILAKHKAGIEASFDASADRAINTVVAGPASGSAGPVTVRALVAADIPALTLAKISDAGSAAARNVGAASGNLVELGVDGKISTSYLPALAITSTQVAANEAAMLALTAEPGDVAVRTDVTRSFILVTSPASTLGNWQELLSPSGGVTGVDLDAGAIPYAIGPTSIGSSRLSIPNLSFPGRFLFYDDTVDVGSTRVEIRTGPAGTDDLLRLLRADGGYLGGFKDYGNGHLYAEIGDIRDPLATVFLISDNNPVGITLNSAYQFYFGRNSAYGNIDVGIASPLPALIKTTDGATGLGGLQTGLLVGVHTVSVTPGSDVGFVDIPVAEDAAAAGSIEYDIEVTDGTDYQVLSGDIRWAAVNKTGTVSTADPEEKGDPMPAVCSSGTLTATFTAITGADKITLRVNVASSLTPTGCLIRFRPHVQSVVAIPTPL